MNIETKRLILVKSDKTMLEHALSSEKDFARFLGVEIAENWTEFGTEPLKYVLNQLTQSDEQDGWWTYFPIHKQDQKLIGSGGYKGIPNENGEVELGYEIAPEYRNLGFATEMTQGLVDHALQDKRIRAILAHTLGEINPSTKVLTKCGFQKIAALTDPEDGEIWKWELKRIL